jgi:hypothetical protein
MPSLVTTGGGGIAAAAALVGTGWPDAVGIDGADGPGAGAGIAAGSGSSAPSSPGGAVCALAANGTAIAITAIKGKRRRMGGLLKRGNRLRVEHVLNPPDLKAFLAAAEVFTCVICRNGSPLDLSLVGDDSPASG